MQEIPFILTEWQELNSLLYAPLSATKRVQYTCIAASTNYIALGATSGSIYLFTREPCAFQQLIPLLEGAVLRAQISPDEKMIALATVRGSVCLITLKPSIKLVTVSTEHLKVKVTCLCWNDNSTEVYAGDESGKISVSVPSTFTVNGMFQSPSSALMNLDSKIVQINFASNLLLISTLNRSYICDTVLEQYKQIGNKPRDGEFGVCFLKTHSLINRNSVESKGTDGLNGKNPFSAGGEITNGFNDEECLPIIYSARPGSRLWEVTATGIVIKTHQFKEALAIPPLPVYKPIIGKPLKLKNPDQSWPVQSINFAQLYVISNKYLFSYTSSGMYILDPKKGEVVLWNDEFPDIFMAHIIGDKIYFMTSSGVFHCLTLAYVDTLILKLHDRKLYKECLDVCQILRPQLMNSVAENACDIIIKQSVDLTEILNPIISLIKSNRNTQPIKLESGIVIVNAGHTNPGDDVRLEESQDLDDLNDLVFSMNMNGTSKTEHHTGNHVIGNGLHKEVGENGEEQLESEEVSSLQKTISSVQNELESLYSMISSQVKSDITEEQLEEVIRTFVETLDNLKEKYEVSSELQNYLFEVIRSAELNYCNSFLENLSTPLLREIKNQYILDQLVNIFADVNAAKYIECQCSFPYPIFGTGTSKSTEPKFYDVGSTLLETLCRTETDTDKCLRLCNQIPYLWKDYFSLKGLMKERFPDNLLKQCLQSRDNLVLSTILPILDGQQWKSAAQCFENIKNGRCANCSKPYDNDQISSKEFSIDWPGVIYLIIKKYGPDEAMTFLFKVHENLPQAVFDRSVYQSIIFSTILNRHGVKHAVELDNPSAEHHSICSPKVLQDVSQSLEKDLEKPVNKEIFGSGPYHWGMRYNLNSSTCPCCTLSLQTPVLLGNNGIALFPCGHAYHVNCMIQKKISRCNLHSQ